MLDHVVKITRAARGINVNIPRLGIFDGIYVILTAKMGSESKKLIVPVSDSGFTTNLEGWTSAGDWYEGQNGWTIGGSSGDSFTFSTTTHTGDFTYSGVADFGGQGGCLGLVFGATNPSSPKSGTWYGANVDTHGSTVGIKLFCNTGGNETWNATLTIPAADRYTLTVTYEDGKLTYTVNGQSVSRTARNVSGTFGLVSWNGGGSFNNVVYTTDEVVPPTTEPPATDDKPVTNPPATNPPATDPITDPTDDPVVTAPVDGETNTPADGDSEAPAEESSLLLPILLGAGAVVAIGVIAAVVIAKKKK